MSCKVSEGQRYVCSNPDCRCEKEVLAVPGSESAPKPYCACGSPMKKLYVKPTLTTLTPGEATALLRKAGLR